MTAIADALASQWVDAAMPNDPTSSGLVVNAPVTTPRLLLDER